MDPSLQRAELKMNDDGPDNTTLNQEAGSASDHLRLAAIDHAEYDALADLFLGDGGYAPEPVQALDVAETNDGDIHRDQDAQNCASNDQQEPTHETHTPVLQLARHEDDARRSYPFPWRFPDRNALCWHPQALW